MDKFGIVVDLIGMKCRPNYLIMHKLRAVSKSAIVGSSYSEVDTNIRLLCQNYYEIITII